ncbi:hypothetical protein BC937DRAFT_93650, partial [Endogone sp. FLAS-F59071]
LLSRFPKLHITLDISHWFVVAERLLTPKAYPALFKLVLPRVRHIHARMGTSQHAQITFVAEADGVFSATALSEEEQQAQQTFEQIWEAWWAARWSLETNFNRSVITMTPEYGPFPYQISCGDVKSDQKNLLAMTNWQAKRLQTLYTKWIDRKSNSLL